MSAQLRAQRGVLRGCLRFPTLRGHRPGGASSRRARAIPDSPLPAADDVASPTRAENAEPLREFNAAGAKGVPNRSEGGQGGQSCPGHAARNRGTGRYRLRRTRILAAARRGRACCRKPTAGWGRGASIATGGRTARRKVAPADYLTRYQPGWPSSPRPSAAARNFGMSFPVRARPRRNPGASEALTG